MQLMQVLAVSCTVEWVPFYVSMFLCQDTGSSKQE